MAATMTVNGYLRRAISTGVVNSVASAAIVAVCLPAIVANLGLERYAVWATLGLFVAAGAALDLGIARALVLLTVGSSERDAASVSGAAAALVGFIAIVGCAGIGVVVGSTWNPFGGDSFIDTRLRVPVLLAGAAIVVIALANALLRAMLESRLALHAVNMGYLLQTALLYAATLTVGSLTRGVMPLIAVTVAIYAVVLGVHAYQLRRMGSASLARPSRSNVARVASAAWQAFAVAAPTAFLAPLLGFALLHRGVGPEDYATFDVGLRIATLCAGVLSVIAAPMLALAVKGSDQVRDVWRFARRYAFVTIALYVAGLAAFAVIGHAIAEYVMPAVPSLALVAAILIAGSGAVAAVEPLTRVLLGRDHLGGVFAARVTLLAFSVMGVTIATATNALQLVPVAYAWGGVAAALVTAIAFARAERIEKHRMPYVQDTATSR